MKLIEYFNSRVRVIWLFYADKKIVEIYISRKVVKIYIKYSDENNRHF